MSHSRRQEKHQAFDKPWYQTSSVRLARATGPFPGLVTFELLLKAPDHTALPMQQDTHFSLKAVKFTVTLTVEETRLIM